MRYNYDYPPDYGYPPPPRRPGLGRRLLAFIALLLIIVVIVVTAVAIQRLNTETVAFIAGGISFTIVIAIPFGLFAALAVGIIRHQKQAPPPPQQMTIPPIILTLPQPQQQGPGYAWPGQITDIQPGPRQWVIGEDTLQEKTNG